MCFTREEDSLYSVQVSPLIGSSRARQNVRSCSLRRPCFWLEGMDGPNINVTKGIIYIMKHFPRILMTPRKLIFLVVNGFAVLLLAWLLSLFTPIRSAHAATDACGNSIENYTGAAFKNEDTGDTYTFNSDGTISSSNSDETVTYHIHSTATSGAEAMLLISIKTGDGGSTTYIGTPDCVATERVEEIMGVKQGSSGQIDAFVWDRPVL